MKLFFYRTLSVFSRFLGSWFFSLIAGGVAAGYFLLFPRRVAVGMRFYQTLLPERHCMVHLWYTLRQFIDFTCVFRDRLLLAKSDGGLSVSFEGREHLAAAIQSGGGILLMSHVGNWEVAARLLKQSLSGLRLMLYMGVKQQEQIEGMQKESVRKSDIRVVGVDQDGGSPLDIVEGIRFLRDGGLASLTGDRVWKGEQRTIAVRFLGRRVHLPAAPYVLAMASGAPIFVFFAMRTSGRHYHFSASAPIHVCPADRSDREAAMTRAAQQYADLLEAAVRRHPFQWHHFEPFLEAETESPNPNPQ